MKKFLLAIACLSLSAGMMAQDVDKATVEGQAAAAKNAAGDLKAIDTGEKSWKFDGALGLNAAATGLVNWAAGGNNNVNGVAFAKLHLLYHKDAIAWETNFDTDFGMTWIDQQYDPLQKSSDNIKLATKFGWEFAPTWYLTALGSFQSQYAFGRAYDGGDGYDQVISKWLAPSYTDISVGIDWKTSVNGADFSIYLSPIAGRISTAWVSNAMNSRINTEYDAAIGAGTSYDFRTDLQQRYGTYGYNKTTGAKEFRDFRAELGLSFKGAIAYKYENLTLSTTLGLFSPYQGKGFDLKELYDAANGAGAWDAQADADKYFQYSNNNRQFGHFDVDWDVAISYQFLKVLNVSLTTSMKYYPGVLIADKNGDLKERVQFKSVLGLGIGYSF